MPSNPGTPRLLRGINDRAALMLLLERGPLSRGRLGELTGLSKPTASQLLTRLESAGLVRRSGSSQGRPGPKAQLYEINPEAAYVAGLDVTPTRILAAVADLSGRTVGTFELRTPRRAGADAVVRVVEALDGALADAGLERGKLARLVIGTPGAFDPRTRRLRYARHLPGWHDADLLERLADAVAVPLEVDNDVNLAAVAELHTGAAQGSPNFVLLWAEEGLGAAIVIDGALHRGATGGAGEVGFLPLPETPLVRDVGRNNAGGFQELAGGKQVLELARGLGIRAGSPEGAVTKALATTAASATSSLTRWRTGSRWVWRRSCPCLTLSSSSSRAASCWQAAIRCSTRCATSSPPWRWRARRSRCPAYRSDRCCTGPCTPHSCDP